MSETADPVKDNLMMHKPNPCIADNGKNPSMRLAFPGWKEEPIDDARFPDIGVAVA
jgi:hypothetical protein